MSKAIPLLSEEYRKARFGFAYCQNCKTVYEDDQPLCGSILCPRCPEWALMRGLSAEEALEKLRDH